MHSEPRIQRGRCYWHRVLPLIAATVMAVGGGGCQGHEKGLLKNWSLSVEDQASSIAVTLPLHLNSYLPNHASRYVLRTQVNLPDEWKGKPLKLAFQNLQAIATLRVNGRRATPVYGEVVEVYRRSYPHVWRIPAPHIGTLELSVEVEHRWVKSAWLDVAPRLYPANAYDWHTHFVRHFNEISLVAGLAVLLTITFTSFLLWLLDKKKMRRAGWLAVQSFLASFILWFETGSMQLVFGAYDTMVVAVTLSGAIVAAVYATHAQFDLGPVRWYWPALWLLNVITGLFAPGPFQAPRYIAPVTVATLVVGLIYLHIILIRVLKHNPRSRKVWIALSLWFMLAALCNFDMIAWLGLGEVLGGIQMKGVGLGLYPLFEFAHISIEHIKSRNDADLFNLQLQDRIIEIEVQRAEIEKLNQQLRQQIEQNEEIMAELKDLNLTLEGRVEDRTKELALSNKELQDNLQKLSLMQQQLMDLSRKAGMSEVATSVLHNVGNVLNSLNISLGCMRETLQKSRVSSLERAMGLIKEHEETLGEYFTKDKKGKQVPQYLLMVKDALLKEHAELFEKIEEQGKSIEHIKAVIRTQQQHAKSTMGQALAKEEDMNDLCEDVLRISLVSFKRHEIEVVREYAEMPKVTVDRHKLFQILVNLVSNAQQAVKSYRLEDRQIIVRTQAVDDEQFAIQVVDNGCGIEQANLTKIFSHGFTTKEEGHGFGLHSSALAAKEMGGSLLATSEGPGKGATFTMTLPYKIKNASRSKG